jgi:transcriptional regulator with GAF, ATPase, and Fis domain/tetratricopeptide (TPR) repeat protein
LALNVEAPDLLGYHSSTLETTQLSLRGRRLVLERELGSGATSTVWLAREGERVFALKLGRGRAQRPRFAGECARLSWVGSSALVAAVDAGVLRDGLRLPGGVSLEVGSPFLLLGYVDGRALDPDRPREPVEAEALALVIARDIGRALADLHASGLAHGDVKPANIVVTTGARGEAETAHLVDLGLATEASEPLPRGGTRRYLAPELADAAGDARLRDLYALGLVLAELLSPAVRRAERMTPELAQTLSGELGGRVRALLSLAPAARPAAEWLERHARRLAGSAEAPGVILERRRAAVRRAYLAVRREELLAVAKLTEVELELTGEPRVWLERALGLARAVAELASDGASIGRGRLGNLGGHGRTRWLASLVGPAAVAWPAGTWADDDELAQRLASAVADREPSSLVFADIEGGTPRQSAPWADADSVELALALEGGHVDAALFDETETRVEAGTAPPALALGLGRALGRRAQLGRALAVLGRVAGAQAGAEAAELLRRAGDPVGAETRARALLAETQAPPVRARLLATLGRITLDRGSPEATLAGLASGGDFVPVLETRALAEMARGDRRAALELASRARVLATSDDARARAEAVRGNVAHAAGDADTALRAFRAAAEHAARAGAVVEEATYLTGVAAAGTQLGELGEANQAARRAVLLFEALGRRVEAGRAMLSVASSHAAAGARDEAREAALDAALRAKDAGDRRCAGFAHLVLADLLDAPSLEGLEHARYAAGQLPAGDDALRAAARLWLHGEASVEVGRLDDLAGGTESGVEARFEWWGARAAVELLRVEPRRADLILRALSAVPSGPVVARGPALALGAKLAARAGDGETARRLTLAAGDAAREILRRAPEQLRSAIASLSWVRAADAASLGSQLSAQQVGDVEALVRALGRRDHLRSLLRQVVDALVLWTGVERGLLLLRAPGGRLLPRAARNLARADLSGRQLELSRSLAERALEAGEPVVAVDAAGDLPAAHESVHALKLRSVLAVPLIAHGEALGVVYLDDRVRRGAFGPSELGWVRLVATLAAIAIADARAQLMLRRAARRAERAEARLSGELARREAELDVAERELARATGGRETRFAYDAIVGDSEAVRAMLRVVDRVTASEVPVLISGESGSGKELVARAIHANGPRARSAFVTENCGAVPEGLLESTLFGHVRGAFTGAVRPRAGLFEVAHGGTLFLDEIAEMSLGMQAKLLRALQDGEIRAVGSETVRRVDVRVIGATHRDLPALVREGKFREDLFYRLNVIGVSVPALRQRGGDVPTLVQHFVKAHAGGRRIRLSRAALDALTAFAWPGNVRQLENEVRRALVLCDETIELEHLSPEVRDREGSEAARVDGLNLRRRLDVLEAELVRTALKRTQGNQTRAAELLGVSRFGLQKMMKRLEIRLSEEIPAS